MKRPAVPPFFPGPVKVGRDWCGADGAHELAHRIAGIWADLGHVVEMTVEQTTGDGRHFCFAVRSNLVGGLPVGRAR